MCGTLVRRLEIASTRCSHCGINYPTGDEYIGWRSRRDYSELCVVCLSPTYFSNSRAVTMDEARKIAGRAEFKRRYERREREREKQGRTTPEQKGSLDALKELRRIRSLRRDITEVRALPESS